MVIGGVIVNDDALDRFCKFLEKLDILYCQPPNTNWRHFHLLDTATYIARNGWKAACFKKRSYGPRVQYFIFSGH